MAEVTKVWFKSKGMWAGILTVAFGIYATLQVQFPSFHLPIISSFLPIIFTILGVFGIYGRVNADGKITFTDQASN